MALKSLGKTLSKNDSSKCLKKVECLVINSCCREQALQGQDIFKVRKRSEVVNRYLEVGVVCDKTFLRFHKQRDVELYVMTVMNMVSFPILLVLSKQLNLGIRLLPRLFSRTPN